ncbi:hypothetical protein, partial [Thiolapillus sp.]|uniref:hypothetical protein n=1 Tax=Thiolapillus sp. TaxID=2017437 RepID=UPI0025D1CECF
PHQEIWLLPLRLWDFLSNIMNGGFGILFTLITEVHTERFTGENFIFRDLVLYIVYTRLHKSLRMWERVCACTQGKIDYEQ